MNGVTVVATTGDPALAVDLEGKIIAWNEAAEYRLGYRRSEVLGRRCWRVLKGRDLSTNRYCDSTCAIRNMALKGEPVHMTDMFIRNGSGEMTPVIMSTLVVQGDQTKEVVHLLHFLSSRAAETEFPVSQARATGDTRLTPRQLEVLQHLGEARSTKEIAGLLCISQATARHHIQNILTRLKVHSRLEAVSLGRRIGII